MAIAGADLSVNVDELGIGAEDIELESCGLHRLAIDRYSLKDAGECRIDRVGESQEAADDIAGGIGRRGGERRRDARRRGAAEHAADDVGAGRQLRIAGDHYRHRIRRRLLAGGDAGTTIFPLPSVRMTCWL